MLRMKRFLGRFHNRVAHRLTGRQPRRVRDGGWVYPLLEDSMEEAGLQEVENYVSRHHNTFKQYITTRPIMDLCLTVKRRPGTRVANMWWKKEGFYLEGMRTADREAEHMEGEEEADGTGTDTDD